MDIQKTIQFKTLKGLSTHLAVEGVHTDGKHTLKSILNFVFHEKSINYNNNVIPLYTSLKAKGKNIFISN